ncbi:polymer-forming cytoskeletal protein [Rhodobacteraceae bacterium 2376]|uniref:Polymer-forming cytoskeletal protein n=1 Tax=Rhabdonatronobacter sediminivivens TaxID=2743469 RepID=A0A7Z0L1J8_9RHOB|nr:polymer-forming cytoskeletal protein [Rhabdonatronobacter sediminivivens]NYS25928.1 polymer-forming cytoskeletal protein [Rhabdonatronobacter sediminivivens]
MFSKSRINEPGPKANAAEEAPARTTSDSVPGFLSRGDSGADSAQSTRAKPAASTLSSDLTITGNLNTTGDVVVEGEVDGDIRAHLLTVGETATIRGEIVADDIVINGRVIGRVRGLKVRLTSSARVEGDIIHKTIAIESGAHFEGSVQRNDDPLATNRNRSADAAAPAPKPAQPAPAAQPSAAVKAATDQRRVPEKAKGEASTSK